VSLFHPTTTSRVSSRSGASPSVQPLSFVRRASPLAVDAPSARRPKSAATNKAPRLRGFHPHEDAFLRFGVTRPFDRSPLRFHAPPGVRTPAMTSAYPKSSAHDVDEFAFKLTSSLVSSVLSPAIQTLLSPEQSARTSFRALPRSLRKVRFAVGSATHS
jgi:hypothetical protein